MYYVNLSEKSMGWLTTEQAMVLSILRYPDPALSESSIQHYERRERELSAELIRRQNQEEGSGER